MQEHLDRIGAEIARLAAERAAALVERGTASGGVRVGIDGREGPARDALDRARARRARRRPLPLAFPAQRDARRRGSCARRPTTPTPRGSTSSSAPAGSARMTSSARRRRWRPATATAGRGFERVVRACAWDRAPGAALVHRDLGQPHADRRAVGERQLADATALARWVAPLLRDLGVRLNLETHVDASTLRAGSADRGRRPGRARRDARHRQPADPLAGPRASSGSRRTCGRCTLRTRSSSSTTAASCASRAPAARASSTGRRFCRCSSGTTPACGADARDHKGRSPIPIFEPEWLRAAPRADAPVELAAIVALARGVRDAHRRRRMPEQAAYDAIPYQDQLLGAADGQLVVPAGDLRRDGALTARRSARPGARAGGHGHDTRRPGIGTKGRRRASPTTPPQEVIGPAMRSRFLQFVAPNQVELVEEESRPTISRAGEALVGPSTRSSRRAPRAPGTPTSSARCRACRVPLGTRAGPARPSRRGRRGRARDPGRPSGRPHADLLPSTPARGIANVASPVSRLAGGTGRPSPYPCRATFRAIARSRPGWPACRSRGCGRRRPERGDRVVVIGLGLVGNFAAQLFQLAGARVLGLDIAARRLEVARACGSARCSTRRPGTRSRRCGSGAATAEGAEVVVEAIGQSSW